MSSLEEEYRKRFGEDRKASDDFDAEGLWANIESDLGNSSSKPMAGHRAKGGRIAGFALLLLGLSIWFFSQNNETNNSLIDEAGIYSAVIFTDSCDQNYPEDLKQNMSSDKSAHSNRLPSLSKASFIPPIDEGVYASRDFAQHESKFNLIEGDNENELEFTDGTVQTYTVVEPAIDIEAPTAELSKNLYAKVHNKTMENRTGQVYWPLDQIDFSVEGSSVDLSKPKLSLVENVYSDKEETRRSALSLQLFSGINTNNAVYTEKGLGDYASLRTQSESSQLGLNSGMNLRYDTKKNWFFGLGLEYQLWRRLLDYESIRQYSEIRDGQVLTIWIDTFTQDTLSVETGQGIVDINETRTIVHNNKYRSFTIPFSLGYQRSKDKISYGFSAAINLNILLSQTGKILDEEGYSAYMDAQTGMLKDLSIGFRLSPFVEYSVKEHVAIFAQGNYDQYLKKDYSSALGLSGRPSSMSLNIGLRYNLGK